jgi:hypothetical protein
MAKIRRSKINSKYFSKIPKGKCGKRWKRIKDGKS